VSPGELWLWVVVVGAVLLALAAAAKGLSPAVVLGAFVVPLVLVAGQRVLLAWPTLLGLILVVILFIPIRRYVIAGGGPISLEPYRVLIALVLGCWLLALAADPDVRWKATGYAGPMMLLMLAIGASLAFNLPRAEALSSFVLKQITFFASYMLVVAFVASVLRSGRQVDTMLKLLVGGSGIIAVCALIEWRTGTNLFNGFGRVIPFLIYEDQGDALARGTGFRAMASAQHPIAMGAALVMMLPIAVYLHQRTGKLVWLIIGGLLTFAALSTGSRTAAIMMASLFVCFIWLKRSETVKMLPHLLILVVLIQGLMPGTLGTFRAILQPSYILKEQSTEMGSGSGRIADLGPSLAEWSEHPFWGAGFGTRVVDEDAGGLGNQQILDNQWLSSLLEMGALGVAALLWLFGRAIRRLARRARSDTGPDGWLATALAASLTAFVVGMFTYDAFAFIQVTFLAFILLGFAAVMLRGDEDDPRALAR
jgi:O-antigen ligase